MSQTMRHYVFIIIAVACGLSNAQSTVCTTPDRKSGTCIDIHQCESLKRMLTQPQMTAAERTFLQRSQCGYFGYVAVCCPNDPTSNWQSSPAPTLVPKSTTIGLEASDLQKPGKCGVDLSDRLVGAYTAAIDAFPWMALLEYQKPNGKGFHCGGSLIHKDYVLTAAHCASSLNLRPLGWRLIGVRLGEYNITTDIDCDEDKCADPVIDVPVVEQIVHPSYGSGRSTQANDIALLRLAHLVEFTDWIKPICLPISDSIRHRDYDGFIMTVAGWGKTENRSMSMVKLELEIEGTSLASCRNIYSPRIQLTEGQMCAGGVKNKDSCRGDSGGPLMAVDGSDLFRPYQYLVGIVSFGPTPCGRENWPGVYTKVDQYIDWILSNMRQ